MSLRSKERRVALMRKHPRSLSRQIASAVPLSTALLLVLSGAALEAQYGAVGLSGVGGRRFAAAQFGNEDEAQFGQVLATGDFNGDGADDLATGIPEDDRSGVEDCGAVLLRYGVPGVGFDPNATIGVQILHQGQAGSPDPLDEADRFGGALAACDFNGDGFDDLAVGIPGEAGPGTTGTTGAVEIFFGTGSGIGASLEFLSPLVPGIPGDDVSGTLFGAALACGNFDGDAFADLAIGAPTQIVPQPGGTVAAGAVVVVYGSAGALDPSTAIGLHQNVEGVVGVGAVGDRFGGALAVGDFQGDGVEDLAVGVRETGTGAVHLFGGHAGTGIAASEGLYYDETFFGGNPEPNDWMGYSLAAGDFDGDEVDELVIGVPFEDVFAATDGGQLIVVEVSTLGAAFWTENLIHGDGATESGDRFGLSLASGDFDGDGFDDLAIGQPGELVVVPEDGLVTVVMGSPTGITNARRHGLAAGYHGNPGVADQANRNYGHAVVTGDFDGDGYADLAIGAPLEDAGGLVDIGAEVVLFGSLFADGFEVGNSGFWSGTVP